MSRYLIPFLFFIFSSSLAYSQEIETEAPLNPAFIKWKENKLKSRFNTGEVPAPVLPNHDWLIAETLKKSFAFDALYDLRTLGLVTVAKDQGACGACWTFASLGSLESAMIKQDFGTYDFSEQSMRTCHGFIFGDNLACSGGNSRKATAYLTRGDGPLLESNVPYDTDNYAACDLSTFSQFSISDVNYYPNDPDIIKQALIDYGALYTNMNYASASYSSVSKTYYYSGTESTNHAVLLVGWDDEKSTNAGKGAWIIKNSWGEDWGENGFFYIAYQDTKINTSPASFHGIESLADGDIIHMYDDLGWISSTGYGSGHGQGLIKFTTVEAQTITSIGTIATAAGAVISAKVYSEKSGDFLYTLLGSTEFESFTYSGYHRLELIEPIALEANKDFYIEVSYSTNFYEYPIPFERYSEGYANPLIKSNVGWIRGTGSTWYPVGNDILDKERDLCIRAYAQSITTSTFDFEDISGSIQIYPQPVRQELNLKLNDDFINQNLVILSSNGTLITNQIINTISEKIDLNYIANGLYLVRIENKNGNLLAQKRFIKVD